MVDKHIDLNNQLIKQKQKQGANKEVDITSLPKTGLFSLGNSKLSPDTLIIDFTSAIKCPSKGLCPMAQASCYAVKDENQYIDTLRKHTIVDNIVHMSNLYGESGLKEFFQRAKEYIKAGQQSSVGVKWVRFNESGDFPNQVTLNAAADFADEIKEEFGVKCMAYSARGDLDFSRASQSIAINASSNDVMSSFDDNAIKRGFFGIDNKKHDTFDYSFYTDEIKKIENNLDDNPKTDYVSKNTIEQLHVNGVLPTDISCPILEKGKWKGGEGYYYVCPCSFWKDEKDRVEIPYCQKYGCKNKKELLEKFPTTIDENGKKVRHKVVKILNSMLSKIPSPCGIKCSVCHDMSGGVEKGQENNPNAERIKNYSVLTAIHGSTSKNFSPTYAKIMRMRKSERLKLTKVETAEGTNPKYKGTWYLQFSKTSKNGDIKDFTKDLKGGKLRPKVGYVNNETNMFIDFDKFWKMVDSGKIQVSNDSKNVYTKQFKDMVERINKIFKLNKKEIFD